MTVYDITEAYGEHQKRLLWLYENAKKGIGLDIGCGDGGTLAMAMAQRNEGNKLFYEEQEGMVGIDIILWLGLEFRKVHPRGKFVGMNIEGKELPFKDNSFDTVLLCETLEHCFPCYAHKLIDEAYRISRGVVLITVPDGSTSSVYKPDTVEHVMHCMIWTEGIMRNFLSPQPFMVKNYKRWRWSPKTEMKYKYELSRDGIFIYVKIFKE